MSVGQFDNEMYMNVLYNSDAIDSVAKTLNKASETINKASKVTERQNEALQKLTDFLNEENEEIEQQIADSHDITKSSFGFDSLTPGLSL